MARPRTNPVRTNIGSAEFPTYRYDLNGKTLFVMCAYTKRESVDHGPYFASVEVSSLCFTENRKVYFPTLAKAEAFAKAYLTTGVDLNKWS